MALPVCVLSPSASSGAQASRVCFFPFCRCRRGGCPAAVVSGAHRPAQQPLKPRPLCPLLLVWERAGLQAHRACPPSLPRAVTLGKVGILTGEGLQAGAEQRGVNVSLSAPSSSKTASPMLCGSGTSGS